MHALALIDYFIIEGQKVIITFFIKLFCSCKKCDLNSLKLFNPQMSLSLLCFFHIIIKINNRMNYKYVKKVSVLAILLVNALNSFSQIKLPNVIGNNMVLQSNQVVPIWGSAAPKSTVTIKFKGQEKRTRTDAKGYWKVTLSAMEPSAVPAEMLITSERDSSVRLANILIGEVWLCSGQSNMRYRMKNEYQKPVKTADSLELELSINEPQIRLLLTKNKSGSTDVVTDGWEMAKGEALSKFSAIGYFFAKNLHRKLNVPVGMICSAVNGTQIEPWTPAATYENNGLLRDKIENNIINGVEAGSLYESMIKPLAPFALRGFLWYQGESNAMTNDTLYADKMKTLILSWRESWENPDLPFYYVTIAPFNYTRRKDKVSHTVETLPAIWEAQSAVLSVPKTEMIPSSDLIDKFNDIHPPYKWEIGRRLSNVALSKQYGYNVEFTGPRYKDMKATGKNLVVSFTHSDGLKTSDGKPVGWLEVAGSDGVFKSANAIIKDNRLIVSSPDVLKPVHLRMGWHENAQPNLVNNAGLPATIFRANVE
jgi:sialate O-acetylesterase